ncbi:hypothetical protein J27TS7_44320 [Paenibacillus dendritiformis]|nr:hypothetical protein J27TS7_44320 [Paenibacillus dendritiformis]
MLIGARSKTRQRSRITTALQSISSPSLFGYDKSNNIQREEVARDGEVINKGRC